MRSLREIYYDKRIKNAVKKGDFYRALEFLRKISSKKRQEQLAIMHLFGYCMNKVIERERDYSIEITTNRQEYLRFRSIVGPLGKARIIIYVNPDTDEIDGNNLIDVIRQVEPNNPLLQMIES